MTQKATPPSRNRRHILLDVEGMHCAGCVSRVEGVIRAVDGVSRVRVNLVTNQASVDFNPAEASQDDLIAAIGQGGYSATVAQEARRGAGPFERQRAEALRWRRRLAVGLGLLLPLVWVTYLGGLSGAALLWSQLLLATPLQLYVGWPYFTGVWQRLRHGSTNMDTLIALGTGAAYLAGVVEFLRGITATSPQSIPSMGAMYFVDAGMILAFITLGKFLEAKAKGRASDAIRKLLDLAPAEANAVRDGRTQSVAVDEVVVGETILVRPGEKVPLDGQVLSGSSAVDQSWLTGESIPVDKQSDDEVLAGTLNGQGALTIRVTRSADQTALAQVIELVRHAQESKTEVGRLANRVVAWFVPAVLLLAGVTFLAWATLGDDWPAAFSSTIAVLVVACPCALGLATPTAVLVGSGRGAEHGILIKEAHALEVAGRLTTVVLDKTGTVTEGRPRVTSVLPAPGVAPELLLATAATAERLSAHPLAEAVVAEAERRGLDVPQADRLDIVPGQGIRAASAGKTILVGTPTLLEEAGIDWRTAEEHIASLRSRAQTPLLVAVDGRMLGVLALADPIAAHSREAVEQLQSLGLEVELLTGDNRATAEAVAGALGIDRVAAEVAPEEKQAVIHSLQKQGKIVAMVGDGINDAPALAAADLGIAVGSGSDVAIEAGDIVLVQRDPRAVGQAVLLSRATLRTIRQNLFWAFLYNVTLLPLAAGLLVPWIGLRLPPAAAAAAMAASSVSVVGNSLLLRARRLR